MALQSKFGALAFFRVLERGEPGRHTLQGFVKACSFARCVDRRAPQH